jgi:hypothetical protein
MAGERIAFLFRQLGFRVPYFCCVVGSIVIAVPLGERQFSFALPEDRAFGAPQQIPKGGTMNEQAIPHPHLQSAATPGLSQWQRVGNIFSAPSRTFEDIRCGYQSWWLPFLLISAITYLLFTVIVFRIGMQQVVNNQISLSPQAEEKLAQVPAEQRELSARISLYVTDAVFIASPVFTLAGVALLSLGLWGTINLGFSGKASYGGILAMWFYATLPSSIKTLLGIVVIYAGTPPEAFNIKNFAPTNIGAFLNPLETNRALYALLTSLDIVQIWSLILLGMGTAIVAGVKRRSGYLAVFGWWAIFVLIRMGLAAFKG